MSTADAYFDRHGYDVDRGDKCEERAALIADHAAMFAIDELRTAYRAAIEAQIKYLTPSAQSYAREYLSLDETSWHDSSMEKHLTDVEDATK